MAADGDLRLICEAWPELPKTLKTGILAMVKTARG
jgi:hypothetical protein